jgi:hypothetical protein
MSDAFVGLLLITKQNYSCVYYNIHIFVHQTVRQKILNRVTLSIPRFQSGLKFFRESNSDLLGLLPNIWNVETEINNLWSAKVFKLNKWRMSCLLALVVSFSEEMFRQLDLSRSSREHKRWNTNTFVLLDLSPRQMQWRSTCFVSNVY